MENGHVGPPTDPWLVYAMTRRPPSREHMLLSEAVTMLVKARFYFGADQLVRAMTATAPDWLEASDREDVMELIAELHRAILVGELQTFARPFGGGRPARLSTDDWEIDDPRRRFAWSAMDPSAPFAADVPPSHWIMVPRSKAEEMATAVVPATESTSWTPPTADVAKPSLSVPPTAGRVTEAPAPATLATSDAVGRFLKREEVLRLTGFSKSTLFAKIEARTFPAQITLGSRMSRWREREVTEWLRDPR